MMVLEYLNSKDPALMTVRSTPFPAPPFFPPPCPARPCPPCLRPCQADLGPDRAHLIQIQDRDGKTPKDYTWEVLPPVPLTPPYVTSPSSYAVANQ